MRLLSIIITLCLLLPLTGNAQVSLSKFVNQKMLVGPENVEGIHSAVAEHYISDVSIHIQTLEELKEENASFMQGLESKGKLKKKDRKALAKAKKQQSKVIEELIFSKTLKESWVKELASENQKLALVESLQSNKLEVITTQGTLQHGEYSLSVSKGWQHLTYVESIPVLYTPQKKEQITKTVGAKTSGGSSCCSSSSNATYTTEVKVTPASCTFKQGNGIVYNQETCPLDFQYNSTTQSCTRIRKVEMKEGRVPTIVKFEQDKLKTPFLVLESKEVKPALAGE